MVPPSPPGGLGVHGVGPLTGAMISLAELLRTALNDPSSVQTSQVSRDVGVQIPWERYPPGTGAERAPPSRRWCSMNWATLSAPPWLCSSPWPCRWPGCASATAGAGGGAGAACVPIGAHWAAAATACWAACPSPPSSSCEPPQHPTSLHPRPKPHPMGAGGAAPSPLAHPRQGQRHLRLCH